MGSNFYENVALPQTVEGAISRICREQDQPPLLYGTRQALADTGEGPSLRILEKIQRTPIRSSFDGFVMYMIRNELNNINNKDTLKRQSPSSSRLNRSPFSSPSKTCHLMMQQDVVTTIGPPWSSSLNVGKEERFSPQLVALGELEFRKAFLILNYIGSETLEEVTTANGIRRLKDLAMDKFEEEVWVTLGQRYIIPDDRCKSVDWESGKAYKYHCYVSANGSCQFKGPYLETSRNHLQRVLGDENILIVKFTNVTNGKSSAGNVCYAEYTKIALEGLLVGLRRYRFFVFKDGGKEARKKDPTSSSVRCLFVRLESNASIDDGKDYVLSGRTIQEARCVFMHVHTVSNMAKYMARLSLILSQTMKLEVDLADVNVVVINDIPCQDKYGNYVYKKDGEPCIHTDGTGYISEDLALKCPKNVFKGNVLNGDNDMGKFSDMKSTESHYRVPPLLIQFRLFNKGCAVKGTLLVNKKLPPRTIQIRPSMIKVKPDPNLANMYTRNSLEVVATSNQPKRTFLSRNLIALLSYGGVPDDFFMDILKNALEESQSLFSNKRTALKVSLNNGGKDDFGAAKMILSGISLDESYLQHRMSIMLNEERKGLLGGKLPMTESYYLMGTVDPTGVLESDQVSIILDNGQISGKVLVFRQPGVHFGDVHLLNARYVESLNEYVGHAKYAIFFPCKGPRSLADEMAGGDFDGDMFFVSKNPQLLDYFKVSEPWMENSSTCGVSTKGPCEFSNEELEDELFKLFLRTRFQPSNAMGIASDNCTAVMDRLLTVEDSNSPEKFLLKEKLLRLIDLYYESLDAPKTGKKIVVPPELRADVFPHYLERPNSFKSTSILGKIYDFVKSYGEELPRKDCRKKWTELYKQYREDMTQTLQTLDGKSKELRDEAADAVYNKYKQELYGGDELEQRQRPLDQIYKEALAIYNISYDYAIRIDDVRKCGFAWKVAGSALLSLYAWEQGEKTLSCAPSVLRELFP
ncbi:probable RNA-dependent RNA polymerase 5 isoform X2 [Herrania umbratica]|uniref:RNA-dependent RNA polymerase n=1 Tax=Herrania umbratica TaxID=108875 RepID=A0A6J0ZQJ4_9ROSI|nr:probable RNA-dependent RNA polymerase 5 isoform X2 [Herrania umbratica]